MGDKKQFSVRLPTDTAEEVEEYAEEYDMSRADALRRAVVEFFVEEDDSAGSQGNTAPSEYKQGLVVLGAMLLGGGILLAVDGTGGGLATLTGGLALLVSHGKLVSTGRAVKNGIRDLETVRLGAVKYLYACILADHLVSWEPRTRVERVARWDLYGLAGILLAAVLAGVIALPVELFGAGAVIDTLGINLTAGVLGVFLILMWVSMVAIAAATLAQLAIATSGDEGQAVEEPANG